MSSQRNAKINSATTAIGFLLLLTLGSTFCLGAPLMLLGIQITGLHLIAGFIVALLITRYFSTTRLTLIAAIGTIISFVVATLIAATAKDVSYDGNGYHQEIINALAFDQWNPYLDYNSNHIVEIWTNHYAKGIEWIEACLVSLIGVLECGKAINLLLATSAGFICWKSLSDIYGNISTAKRTIILTILVMNPVAIGQMLTFYIDYAFYYYLLLTIAFSIAIFRLQNIAVNYIGLIATIVLAVATKFNAFFMEGCSIGAILLGCWLYKRSLLRSEWRRYITIVILTTAVASLLICWHPYVTNFITHGHPLYPLMGNDTADIMTGNTPDYYAEGNRITNFLRSAYALQRPSVDQRIGGFGPLFGLAFTVSLIWLLFTSIKQRRLTLLSYCGVIALLFCFIFEQSWWARYNTQLWLLPSVVLLSCCISQGKVAKWTFWVLSAILIGNISICGACALLKSIEATSYKNAIYSEFNGKTIRLTNIRPQWQRQFNEHNINVTKIALDSVNPDYMLNFTSKSFMDVETDPVIALNKEQRERIDSAYKSSIIVTLLKTQSNDKE